MNLTATVLRHNGLLMLRQPLSWELLAALLAGLALATWAGIAAVKQTQATQTELTLDDRQRVEHAEVLVQHLQAGTAEVSRWRDPRSADVAGRRLTTPHALLPPTSLSALALAHSDLVSPWYAISLEPLEQVLAQADFTSPQRLAKGRLDFTFILIYLAPLMIIALSYTVLTWERQQGLYPLLQVQCRQLRKWLVVRHSMRVAWIALPIVSVAIVTVMWLGPSAEDLLRLFLWSLLALTYLAFWGIVTACATIKFSNSQQTLLSLAGIWLVLVILMPALASNLTNFRYPAPSYIEYIDAMRKATDEARSQGSKLLANYLEDHPELAAESVDTRNFFAQRFAVQMSVEQALQPFSFALQQQRQGRHQLSQWMRFFSPALLATDGLVDTTGGGPARHQHFLLQVNDFHQQWREFFAPHILSDKPFSAYSVMPVFEYQRESLTALTWRFLVVWGGLLLMCAVPTLVIRRRGTDTKSASGASGGIQQNVFARCHYNEKLTGFNRGCRILFREQVSNGTEHRNYWLVED